MKGASHERQSVCELLLVPLYFACCLGRVSNRGCHLTFPISYLVGNRMGICRTRMPVAAKTALATAGAMAIMGVSPAPAEGTSGRSSRWMSISGRPQTGGPRIEPARR